MIKLAILSDSHKKPDLTKNAIDMLKSKGAEYIIHAGDLEIIENLELLKNSGLIYTSVFGNNDYNLIKYQKEFHINQEPYYFKIKDTKFKLMHIPNYLTPDTDVIISGHTHQFEHSYKNNTLYLNPGEICARNKNKTESVLLTIDNEKYIIDFYSKNPNDINWELETIEYKKDKKS